MNYPVWYLPFIGGPLIIAFVAIIHVVVSHFAVGGGLWLVLTEKKGYREKKDYIVDYVKKHSKFFLLLTMVFSALTGVGIWFTIALIHPDATSHLIHTFVFAWAIEWVLFVIEIVTAFLYFYNFGKISKKLHLLIGWIYFFAAWGSLLVINGILAFMLTPGKWLATQNFWDGIFNPSYLSSTVFRTFLCFALAGSYGLMTATRKFKGEQKNELVKYNGKWIFWSLAGLIPSAFWYYSTFPVQSKEGIAGSSKIMVISLWHLVISLAIFILFLLFFYLWKTEKFGFKSSIAMFLTIFVFFGAFEFIREAGRKPYIIKDYMYSTGIKVADFETVKSQSVLRNSKWTEIKEVTQENIVKAGGEIFRVQCYACHSLGMKNNINKKMADWDYKKIKRIIGSLKGITPFMPGFAGTEIEKEALAKWFYYEANGKLPQEEIPSEVTLDGKALFESFCSDCHENSTDDPLFLKTLNITGIDEMMDILSRLNELNEDMPPFEGNDQEKKALAEYIIKSRSEK